MPWIHNALVLPLIEPERHRGLRRRLRELERFDASPRDRQLEIQEGKVRRILQHAYQTTPYYKELFDDAGFRVSDWRSGRPIPVPVLTRDLLRSNVEKLRSRAFPAEALRGATTGGTTSAPVPIWRDIEALRDKTALQFHLNRRSGFDQGTRVLMIWGAERDLALNPSWKWKLYEQGLMRRYNAGAGQLSEQVLQSFAEKLSRHRPRIIFGYGATICRFAEYLRAKGEPFHKPSRLIVTAEPITPQDRETMENIFECPVTEHYGSRDIGMVAAQCDQGKRLHFHPAACYPELVYGGQTSEGPMYQLIVTDLLNSGMPMVRYDTADCVLLDDSPCECGSWFPSVKTILGRTVDNFPLPDGSVVTGISVTAAVARIREGFLQIRQIQLIQKDLTHLHVRYVAEGDPILIQRELERFRVEVQTLFQMEMRWTTERVPEIRRERSGKLRFCISEVSGSGSGLMNRLAIPT
jgi:phenylacetate-CoA ligase